MVVFVEPEPLGQLRLQLPFLLRLHLRVIQADAGLANDDGDQIVDPDPLRLRRLDEVAYVRFASVYRSFRDVDEFMQEMGKLVRGKPTE